MFAELRKCGFLLVDATLVSVILACGSLGDLDSTPNKAKVTSSNPSSYSYADTSKKKRKSKTH
jgi:hypothetical protein